MWAPLIGARCARRFVIMRKNYLQKLPRESRPLNPSRVRNMLSSTISSHFPSVGGVRIVSSITILCHFRAMDLSAFGSTSFCLTFLVPFLSSLSHVPPLFCHMYLGQYTDRKFEWGVAESGSSLALMGLLVAVFPKVREKQKETSKLSVNDGGWSAALAARRH